MSAQAANLKQRTRSIRQAVLASAIARIAEVQLAQRMINLSAPVTGDTHVEAKLDIVSGARVRDGKSTITVPGPR